MATVSLHQPIADQTAPSYAGTPSTADGSSAVVWVESHISQAAVAYPITPSTPMGDSFAAEFANGKRNLWGERVQFLETESEHSSASACEGFALAGGRVTNFTSGQGLILMKEVLYVIAGKRLPVVFHIGARAITSQSLNIHCGHDDVMGVADCGWGMLFARNAQEAGHVLALARITDALADAGRLKLPLLPRQLRFADQQIDRVRMRAKDADGGLDKFLAHALVELRPGGRENDRVVRDAVSVSLRRGAEIFVDIDAVGDRHKDLVPAVVLHLVGPRQRGSCGRKPKSRDGRQRAANIRVAQSAGLGLDERAIEAVRRWRFRPALAGDRGVVAPAVVEVNFRLM